MDLHRFAALTLVASLLASPLAGQGIPRSARRLGAGNANAPRLMVANPYVYSAADSTASVTIADAMRERMERVAGRDFLIIPDSIMNSALTQYGYSPNAILSPQLALQLAKQIQARVILMATMNRAEAGRYRISARFIGVNDDAGYLVSMQQEQPHLNDFGNKVADALAPAADALSDAKGCVDNRQAKPEKALESALKAVKKAPNHGLAELCLAYLAEDKKAPREEVIQHLENAVKGDSLSLTVWTKLVGQYEAVADTNKMVAAMQQTLRVAPTNQKLREDIFRKLLNIGRIDAAKNVADEGLKLDPNNFDLYDLKSNACLFASDFKCAIDALEVAYTQDSARADTLFFTKISVAAQQQPDTLRLLKWTQIATAKYPDNITLLQYLNQAFVLNGQVDSSTRVTRRLMELDTTAVVPALAAAQALFTAKRYAEVQPYADFVKAHGDTTQRAQLVVMYVNTALGMLQPQADSSTNYPGSADLARQAIAIADPKAKVAMTANYILGLATFLQVPQVDPEAEKQKSCELAKKEDGLLTESEAALKLGQAAAPDKIPQYLGYIDRYKPRVASMIKAYCK